MSFTESNYENAILNLFTDVLGYSYAYGPDIDRDYHDTLYEELLLSALQRINPGLPMEALNEAVYKIKNFETGTLLQKNMTFTDYMQSGVPVKYFVDGEVKTQSEEAYTSHNTKRLDVDGVVEKIMTTEYVQNALKGLFED